MIQINNFNLQDIVISDDFLRTPPSPKKLERNQDTTKPVIIINSENVLIDGYATYINAIKQGKQYIDLYRGHTELILAKPKNCEKLYYWKIPPRLYGTIQPGDRCRVWNAKTVSIVTVSEIVKMEYPIQDPRLKSVINKK